MSKRPVWLSIFLTLIILRVSLKGGEKTDYLQTYQNFGREQSASLQELTNGASKSDVVVLLSSDNMFDVYPDSPDSLKEVAEHREKLIFYRLNRQMNVIAGYKITANLTAMEEVWKASFESTKEVVMAFKESKTPYGPRESEFTVSGKTFKKYSPAKPLLAVLTLVKEKDWMILHLINPLTGTIITSTNIATKIPAKVPLMVFYDNAVVIGLHHGKDGKDVIILVDVCVAPEIADTSNTGANQEVKKASESELTYALMTTISVEWKVLGLQIIRADKEEYIASVDENHNLRMIQTDKLARGGAEKTSTANSKEIKVPEGTIFRGPVNIEYDKNSKTVFLHGMDLCSLKFP